MPDMLPLEPDPWQLPELDVSDRRSISQQIADRLRHAIRSGAYPPGSRLPSQPELADRYGVARETVKAALRILSADQLTIAWQGRGTFVRDAPRDRAEGSTTARAERRLLTRLLEVLAREPTDDPVLARYLREEVLPTIADLPESVERPGGTS